MNIIRGIDRIAWAVAVLAAAIGLGIGFENAREGLKTITPAYQAWENNFGDIVVKNPSSPLHGAVLQQADRPEAPEKYEYPAWWKCGLGGVLLAVVFFFGSFVFLRISSRGVKKLSVWLIGGFRDK